MWCSVDDIVGKRWGNRSLKSHLSSVKEDEKIPSGNKNGNINSGIGIVGIGNGNNSNDYVSSNSVLKQSRCVRVFDNVRELRCHNSNNSNKNNNNNNHNNSIAVIGNSSLLPGKSSKKILINSSSGNKKKKLYFDICSGKKVKENVADKVRNVVVVKKYDKTAASLDKIKRLHSATDLTDYIHIKKNNEDKKIKNTWYNDDGGDGGGGGYDDENDDFNEDDSGRNRYGFKNIISEKSSYGNNNELEERVVLLEERLPTIVSASSSSSSSCSNDTLSTTTSSTFLRNGKFTTTSTITRSTVTPTSSPIVNSNNKKYNNNSSSNGRPKIDMLLPTLKSLVTMTTNKISTNSTTMAMNVAMGHTRTRKYSNIRRNTSLDNVNVEKHFNLRKCSTMMTLEEAVQQKMMEGKSYKCQIMNNYTKGIHPINRLRIDENDDKMEIACSRCSSLLSMASSSKYSINSNLGFVPLNNKNNISNNNNNNDVNNYCDNSNDNNNSTMIMVSCKVCLNEVQIKDSWTLQHCQCSYCVQCVRSYVEFEINQGAYSISCPDAECEKQGIILLEEVESLVSLESVEKHKRYRLNKEVEIDKSRTWCPKPGCETVCTLSYPDRTSPQSVNCPTCITNFCSNCRVDWHPGSPCKTEDAVPGISFDSELIKCCPMCSVPIEKDEGCAQMLCKRCKHVFCWYCLASLDDDFLLRHYDKGPCKNKLGHSRASVIWHRAQVISIFAGFGILLLIASPLLLLAAPCIVCCKCRVCTSDSKLDTDEDISVSGDNIIGDGEGDTSNSNIKTDDKSSPSKEPVIIL